MLKYFSIFIIIFGFFYNSFAQFRIHELDSGFEKLNDSTFLDITKTRYTENFNKDWKFFFADKPEIISKVNLPIKFNHLETIIFEKEFSIPTRKVLSNLIQLYFLGLNYSAEIFVNNSTVYKHGGGSIPFVIDLKKEILNFDSPNVIRIKMSYNIDSENTIPVLQQFLFPKNLGGIFRDVYLYYSPIVRIENFNYSLNPDTKPYKNKLDFSVSITDYNNFLADSLIENLTSKLKLEVQLKQSKDTSVVFSGSFIFDAKSKKEFSKNFSARLSQVDYWNPSNPNGYLVNIKLYNDVGYLLDEVSQRIKLLELKKDENKLFLNGENFKFNGVTYLPPNESSFYNYEQIKKDILLIKEAGFNSVRFAKNIPHPYAIHLCEEYGLLAFIELPLNSIPERFTEDSNFQNRAALFISRTIQYYSKYSNFVAFGVGSSYLSNSISHGDFITLMNSVVKQSSPKILSYSSSIGYPLSEKGIVDLYGIELYGKKSEHLLNSFLNEEFPNDEFIFLSEVTYPTYNGATNGYLNDYSFEAQAKFFDDIIKLTKATELKGFFLNSIFDFQGDFAPFFSGYSDNNNYHIGILPNDRSLSRISYNLIKSRLSNGSKISLPIGSSSDDSPLFFIISALFISLIISLLLNSKRKFREDATRALFRPYNFFADIRDQRILYGFHTNILMFLLAGSNALLITILLFYLKNNFLFEKIIVSFADHTLTSLISYLAWNPIKAFIFLFLATIIIFLAISIFAQLMSFFVKNKVLYSSIYYVTIWAFLPLALLLPFLLVLYKILLFNSYNIYLFIILLLYLLWNIQRFLKGIYIVFDTKPFNVYAFSVSFIVLVLFITLGYFQFNNSTIDYMILAIKQYFLL